MGPGPARDALLGARIRVVIRIKSSRICRTRGFRPCERPDIEQELITALVAKAHLYDPARGASFVTWVSRVLDKEGLMLVRARHRMKRAPGYAAKSLDSGYQNVRGDSVSLHDVVTAADRGRITGGCRPRRARLTSCPKQSTAPWIACR